MRVAETERLELRHLTADDAGALAAVFCDPEVMHYSDGVQTPAWVPSWAAEMIDACYPAWGFGIWAALERATGVLVGYCGLSRFPGRCEADEAELGFRLARAYWGRGYATEAAAAALDHGVNALRPRRVIAIVDPENLASLQLVQKIGMTFEGEITFAGYTHPDHVYVTEDAASS